MKCHECGASLSPPAELAVTVATCHYCGHQHPLGDLAERQRLLLEHKRLEQEGQRQQAELARVCGDDQRAQQRDDCDCARASGQRSFIVATCPVAAAPPRTRLRRHSAYERCKPGQQRPA